jgi:DUF4097 and DUF4098 domain-containing protein YvlB
MKIPRFLSLLPTALASCALAAAAAASQPIDRRMPADAHGTVEINLTAGLIQCEGWDKAEVQITGELGGSSERLDVQQQGSTITIRVLAKSGFNTSRSESELHVKVPSASAIRISAVSADVNVTGIMGDQRLQSVSGDVQTEAASADVTMKSISGNLHVRGKKAPLRLALSTVSGNANVTDLGGELELDTVSGDVDIDMSSLSRARMKTISGDLVMTARLSAEARIDATSVSGDLRLRWPGAENSAVDMESFSGDISSCFGGIPVQRPKYGPGSNWRYAPANAKGDIHVKSMSGDITLCNR